MLRKIALLVILVSSLVCSGFASASDNVVSGTVYMLKDSKFVSGASITVVCNNHVKKAVSDSNGNYNVFYSLGECGRDSKVKITAKKGRLFGSVVETMRDHNVEVDIAIADVFVKKTGTQKPKLQLTGFVDDFTKDVFVRLDNYGGKSDAVLTATLINTGEYYREDLKLGKNEKLLKVFAFGTIDYVAGENVIELFAKAGDFRSIRYISYFNGPPN